jgi:hypothetical protein
MSIPGHLIAIQHAAHVSISIINLQRYIHGTLDATQSIDTAMHSIDKQRGNGTLDATHSIEKATHSIDKQCRIPNDTATHSIDKIKECPSAPRQKRRASNPPVA